MSDASTPNVVFLVLDTVRALSVSWYGDQSPKTTPFLDELAAKNVGYEHCITPSPWTLPSHTSMFTGLMPGEHGVNNWEDRLPNSFDTMASLFANEGYQTMGASNNLWVSHPFGLSQGFEDFYLIWQLIQQQTDLYKTSHDIAKLSRTESIKRIASDIVLTGNPVANVINSIYGKFFHNRYDYGARRINKIVRKWFDRNRDESRPFFFFANYLEAHRDYDPLDEYAKMFLDANERERAREIPQEPIQYMLAGQSLSDEDFRLLTKLYHAEMRYLDDRIRELFEILEDNDALEETLVVVVGDHGENIGDHGLMSHMYSLHDTLVRVPCVVRLPSGLSMNVSEQIQTTDLFSLVFEATGLSTVIPDAVKAHVPPPLGESGREYTFAELLAENPPQRAVERRTDGNYDREKFAAYRQSRRAIRTPTKKIVKREDGTVESYTINGFDERSDNQPDQQLVERLDAFTAAQESAFTTADSDMSASTKRHLQDLGYL